MAIPLRARRAPVMRVGTAPSALPTHKESPWPVVLMAALLVLGFLFMAFMVYIIFSPGMA